jgi:hypothetical protein
VQYGRDTTMTLKEMRDTVLEDMEHIPRHPKPAQSYLRAIYFTSRMRSLGKKAKEEQTASQVLQECIDFLKKVHPGIEFRYDQVFFQTTGNRRKG